MSSERPPRTEQRYSRFSRASYDDILPPQPPEEPTLTEIAMRALNGNREPNGMGMGRPDHARWPAERQWDQPLPPDPLPSWADDEPEPVKSPPLTARSSPVAGPMHQPPRQALRDPVPPVYEPAYEAEPEFAGTPLPQAGPAERPARKTPSKDKARKRRGPARAAGAESAPKGPGLFARSMTIARQKAAPALMNAGLWLAQNLRRRELRKRYNRALVLGHTRLMDKKLEELFFVPSRKAERIDPAPERGIHYDGPVPASVFAWVMSMMPSDLRQFAFIDISAGLGRASLLASKWNFNRIVAYEYDPQTFDDLQMNIAQFPRSGMACRNIDCYRGDVDGIRLPDQPCVIYFSSAWREPIIPGVMGYVRDTYRQSPRRIYVVLENTGDDTGLEEDGIFERIEPPLPLRLKLKLLSPMDFRVYRSLV
jgi:hypothetical protein